MKLSARTILVTGGTSGIGRELARRLLERDNVVIVTGRDADRLAETRLALPGVRTMVCDVADADAIAALHARIVVEHPDLDVLVNNAGIMRKLDLRHGPVDVTRELDVNLAGPIRMVQSFLPLLERRPEALVVNVTSGLAYVPLAIAPVYSATKAGLHAYTQSLRHQLRRTRVRVVELAPPGVDTPLLHGDFTADDLGGIAGMDVAILVSKALAGIESGRAEIRPGVSQLLRLMSRLAPDFVAARLARNADRMGVER